MKVSSDEITKPKDIIPPKVPVVASVNSGPVAVTSNPINPIVMDRPRLFDRNKTDQSHQSVPSTAVIPPVQKPPALTKPAVPAVPEPTQIVYTLPTAQLDNKSTLSDIHTGFTNPSFFGTVTAPSNTVVERSELIRSSSLLSDDGGTPAVAPQATTQPQRRPRASWGKGLIIQPPKVVEEPRKPVEVPETIEEEKAKIEEILVKEEKETSKNDFSVKMESEEVNVAEHASKVNVSTHIEKEAEVVEVEQDMKVEMDEENTNQEKTEEEQLREQNEEENRIDTQEDEESVPQISNKVRKRNRSQRNEPEDSDNEEEIVPEAQKDPAATVDSSHLSSDEAELPQRKKRGRPFTVKDSSPPTSPHKPVAIKEEVHVRDVSPVPSLKEQTVARGATGNNTGRGRGGRGRGGGRWANRHVQQEVVANIETEEATSKKPAVSAPTTTTVAPTAKKGATAKEKKPTAASTAVAIAERHHLGNIFSRETDIHRAYNTMAYILELQKTQITDTSNQRAISNLAMVSNLFQGIKTVQAASKLSIPRSSEICYALDLVDTNLEVYYTLLGNQRAKQYLTESK